MQFKDPHIFAGMQKDITPAVHEEKFLYDAHNIRITPGDNLDTLFSITNEKGTLLIDDIEGIDSITGSYLGHAIVGEDTLILFTTASNKDYIYKLTFNDGIVGECLYQGNLGFDLEYPIEAFSIVETGDIKKVYWTDGKNQPRILRLDKIKYRDNTNAPLHDTQFDFVPTLTLQEDITIEKRYDSGVFAPGVIQYAFTYYNKYMQQSNIFYTSLLQYISFSDRGGSPEERVNNSFKITIKDWQEGFDYLRIYSIQRTSLDGTPQTKIVMDIDLSKYEQNDTIEVIDNGEIGSFIEPQELIQLNNRDVTIKTWDIKDSVLFSGNIKLSRKNIDNIELGNPPVSIVEYVKNHIEVSVEYDTYTGTREHIQYPGFKAGELYRLGIQAQYKDGSWSQPIWIKDEVVDYEKRPKIETTLSQNNSNIETLYIPYFTYIIPPEIKIALLTNHYLKVRAVCVIPSLSDRLILTQGILNPTINVVKDFTYSQSENWNSWYFRPSYAIGALLEPEFVHGNIVRDEFSLDEEDVYPENKSHNLPERDEDKIESIVKNYTIDQRIVTLNSPEVELNDAFNYINSTNITLNVVGHVDFTNTYTDKLITTASPAYLQDGGADKMIPAYGNSAIKSYLWKDAVLEEIGSDGTKITQSWYEDEIDDSASSAYLKSYYCVYPWHRSGSLNNDLNSLNYTRTALLKKKVFSRLLDSDKSTIYFSEEDYTNYQLKTYNYINSDQANIEYLNKDKNADNTPKKYKSNLDTVIGGTYGVNMLFTFSDSFYYEDPTEGDTYTVHSLRELFHINQGGQIITSLNPINIKFDFTSLVPIKYKSTAHFVFSLNKVLPRFRNISGSNKEEVSPDEQQITQEYVPCIYFNADTIINKGYISIDNTNFNPIYSGSSNINVGYIEGEDRNSTNNINGRFNRELIENLNAGDYIIIIEAKEVDGNTAYTTYLRKVSIKDAVNNKLELTNPDSTKTVRYKNPGNESILYATFVRQTSSDSYNGWFIVSDTMYPDSESETPKSYEVVIDDDEFSPHLFLGEMTRAKNEQTDFGGNSKEALRNNLWIPASEAVKLGSNNGDSVSLTLKEGDTWYQKYYCLKTYPFSLEDENQIIDLASFYCETRENLMGIYDKMSKGPSLFLTKEIFNKYNPVYSQRDNFFNYRILDEDFYDRNNFPYSITWSLDKQVASDIDAFTHMTLATTLDANSKYGQISKIITYNDAIFCFQQDAINRIMFNSRVQISASDGVPIELANSNKVESITTINNNYGTLNPTSVVSAEAGLFFIDDIRKGFLVTNEKGEVVDISLSTNMKNWFRERDLSKSYRDSNYDWKGTRVFNDYTKDDIYIIREADDRNEGALVYSKKISQFMSFMDYGETDCLFNINNKLYALRTNISNSSSYVNLYALHEGNYNYFFDSYKPFDLTFISNVNATEDKIFTNVETRCVFTNNKFFDYIKVDNDYQTTDVCQLDKQEVRATNHFNLGGTKRKFRIWRTDIPRSKVNNAFTLDRIRSTWAKIKFGMNTDSTNLNNLKMELYNMDVLFHSNNNNFTSKA